MNGAGLANMASGGLQLASNVTAMAGAPPAVSYGLSQGASLAQQFLGQMQGGGGQ